jgi:imidazolonepropionase-like amidohydrolase
MINLRLLAAWLLALIAPAGLAADVLFTNGKLITFTDRSTINADLRVVDQRILAIGEDLERGPETTVIDLEGGYLMPGVAEMHAHVPSPAQSTRYRDDVLFLWVANGVTTARGMLGHPEHLELRRALAAHEILGPRLITSGPSFNGNSVDGPAAARDMARQQAAAGYDFLKIHPGLTVAEYDAMADEAGRLGIPFAGHVPVAVGLERAIAAGQVTIDHLDGILRALAGAAAADDDSLFGVGLADEADLARLGALIPKLRAAGVSVVPTETLLENFAAAPRLDALLERPEAVYLPPALTASYRDALSGRSGDAETVRQALDTRKHIIAALHDAGVDVLLGSDSPQIFNVPGFSIHRELEALVAAGLTPLEALATGTTAPARFFGRERDFGTLAPGLAADLVWLRADPTAAIGNTRSIRGVMVRGRWLDRAALDAGLEDIRRRYAQP